MRRLNRINKWFYLLPYMTCSVQICIESEFHIAFPNYFRQLLLNTAQLSVGRKSYVNVQATYAWCLRWSDRQAAPDGSNVHFWHYNPVFEIELVPLLVIK